jgi:hypothetical protein
MIKDTDSSTRILNRGPLRDVKSRHRGFGDRIERLARPIAKAIDRVAGTNIQGCGACQKRKEYLNEKFPIT